jgi:ankyrin repeat protein
LEAKKPVPKAKAAKAAKAERARAEAATKAASGLQALARGRAVRREAELSARAAVQARFDAARELLQRRAAVRQRLWDAVEDGDTVAATALLLPPGDGAAAVCDDDVRAAVQARTREGETVLFEAAGIGEDGIVALLLQRGAAPCALDNRGRSALYRACYNGHEGAARALLVAAGAVPMEERLDLRADLAGDSALSVAPPKLREALLPLLPQQSAAPPAAAAPEAPGAGTTGAAHSPVSPADVRGCRRAGQRFLEAARRGDVVAVDAALAMEGGSGDAAVTVALVEARAEDGDIGVPPSVGAVAAGGAAVDASTALCAACAALPATAAGGNKAGEALALEVAAALLRHGAAPDAQNVRGTTPLMHAASRGCAAMVQLLLRGGATTWLQDGAGRTALVLAPAQGGAEVRAALLQADGWSGVPGFAGSSSSGGACGGGPNLTSFLAARRPGADQTRELRSMGADELAKGGAKYRRLLEERALAELGYS